MSHKVGSAQPAMSHTQHDRRPSRLDITNNCPLGDQWSLPRHPRSPPPSPLQRPLFLRQARPSGPLQDLRKSVFPPLVGPYATKVATPTLKEVTLTPRFLSSTQSIPIPEYRVSFVFFPREGVARVEKISAVGGILVVTHGQLPFPPVALGQAIRHHWPTTDRIWV
ncbi:hypothetical protein J6590_095342 [Homalodisca vitripennis]|nr:hypothetical protein J6590_095342 [Homalodisca vitripennis]